MTLYYLDPEMNSNVPVKSREQAGEHVLARDIDRLPGTVESDISASKGFLQTLASAISSARQAVALPGTSEADIGASKGFLQTLASAVSTGRMLVTLSTTVEGYLQTLAGSIATGRQAVSLTTTEDGYLSTLAGAILTGNMKVVLQAGANAIGKLAANSGVNIGTVDVASGTISANQAIPANVANAWPIKTTDGTNIAAVKGASTAAGPLDSALVVAVSPNNTIPVSSAQLPATLGTKPSATSLPVVIASDQSVLPVTSASSATSATAYVAATSAGVTLLAANSARVGAIVCNDSVDTMRLKLGTATVTSTNYTALLVSGAYYELPFNWKGQVTGAWITSSASGGAVVTEVT